MKSVASILSVLIFVSFLSGCALGNHDERFGTNRVDDRGYRINQDVDLFEGRNRTSSPGYGRTDLSINDGVYNLDLDLDRNLLRDQNELDARFR